MKNVKLVLTILLVALLVDANVCIGQGISFKKYTNQANRFSFDMPASWSISYSRVQGGSICTPVSIAERKEYAECFEGIVFRLEVKKLSLDSVLVLDGYKKVDGSYYTTDRVRDSVKAEYIKGSSWTGICHNNICGISCKETGFHAAAGECEFFYFSSGNTTVLLMTNGRALSDPVRKRLLSSFTFNK
ncbi:hypothetical protein [Paraflavitalea pollutisoli]|uniref:hypothetical protein n=1 Tax=Paraflavitalea pollutisoli TaxID=3034143 RepID=UPI0023EAB76E|nr:hypothetical protein [Paraflavitalea sp. H1-2-19X]